MISINNFLKNIFEQYYKLSSKDSANKGFDDAMYMFKKAPSKRIFHYDTLNANREQYKKDKLEKDTFRRQKEIDERIEKLKKIPLNRRSRKGF